jgi:hypothetical protein
LSTRTSNSKCTSYHISPFNTLPPTNTSLHSAVEHICKDQSLDSDFDKADLIGDGFTRKLLWQKEGKKKDCGFDCQTLFAAFTESDKCITGTGMQKNGEIVTECGTASYLGYNLAG